MFQCAKAVWPLFLKQKYGRIIIFGSQAGLCAFLRSSSCLACSNFRHRWFSCSCQRRFTAIKLSMHEAHCLQYCTVKAGVLGFTKTLAIEGRKNNILANIVIPSAGAATGLGR